MMRIIENERSELSNLIEDPTKYVVSYLVGCFLFSRASARNPVLVLPGHHLLLGVVVGRREDDIFLSGSRLGNDGSQRSRGRSCRCRSRGRRDDTLVFV